MTACPQQENNVVLDLGEANLALILASIGQEANAEEAEYQRRDYMSRRALAPDVPAAEKMAGFTKVIDVGMALRL